jgi:hypothetical protein
MGESSVVPEPALSPTELAIRDVKRRIGEAVAADDLTAIIAHARGLRSAQWRRDREQQMAAAAADRAARKRTNRELN